MFSKHSFILRPIAWATGGGNALPIMRQAAVFLLSKPIPRPGRQLRRKFLHKLKALAI